MMLGTCRPFPPKPYEFTISAKFASIKCCKSLARQEFLQFEAPRHEPPQFFARRLGFDLFLQFGEFFLHAPVAQNAQTAFGRFPGDFAKWLEKNFKQQPAVPFLERG